MDKLISHKKLTLLTRNPLGILALFIFFMHSISTLAIWSDQLSMDQRNILVWFVVLYPCLVLATFFRLVAYHHEKLYAPNDFQKDSSFLKTVRMSVSDQKTELGKEAEIATASETSNSDGGKTANEAIDKRTVTESIVLAEDLVLKKIEFENRATITRSVKLNDSFYADGIFQRNGTTYVVEVLFSTSPIRSAILDKFVRRISVVIPEIEQHKVKVILAIVYRNIDGMDCSKESTRISQSWINLELDFELYIYGLDQLREDYGIIEK